MTKTVRVSGRCPETGCVETVAVTFAGVRMVGNPSPGYKATGYRCAHAGDHGCSSGGTDGRACPLFLKAVREMT